MLSLEVKTDVKGRPYYVVRSDDVDRAFRSLTLFPSAKGDPDWFCGYVWYRKITFTEDRLIRNSWMVRVKHNTGFGWLGVSPMSRFTLDKCLGLIYSSRWQKGV